MNSKATHFITLELCLTLPIRLNDMLHHLKWIRRQFRRRESLSSSVYDDGLDPWSAAPSPTPTPATQQPSSAFNAVQVIGKFRPMTPCRHRCFSHDLSGRDSSFYILRFICGTRPRKQRRNVIKCCPVYWIHYCFLLAHLTRWVLEWLMTLKEEAFHWNRCLDCQPSQFPSSPSVNPRFFRCPNKGLAQSIRERYDDSPS